MLLLLQRRLRRERRWSLRRRLRRRCWRVRSRLCAESEEERRQAFARLLACERRRLHRGRRLRRRGRHWRHGCLRRGCCCIRHGSRRCRRCRRDGGGGSDKRGGCDRRRGVRRLQWGSERHRLACGLRLPLRQRGGRWWLHLYLLLWRQWRRRLSSDGGSSGGTGSRHQSGSSTNRRSGNASSRRRRRRAIAVAVGHSVRLTAFVGRHTSHTGRRRICVRRRRSCSACRCRRGRRRAGSRRRHCGCADAPSWRGGGERYGGRIAHLRLYGGGACLSGLASCCVHHRRRHGRCSLSLIGPAGCLRRCAERWRGLMWLEEHVRAGLADLGLSDGCGCWSLRLRARLRARERGRVVVSEVLSVSGGAQCKRGSTRV